MVEVMRAHIKKCRDGRPTFYVISVQCKIRNYCRDTDTLMYQDAEWEIERRYNEFCRFHEELQVMSHKPLYFPRKGLMLWKSSHNDRLHGLNQFLSEAIDLLPFLSSDRQPFAKFFSWSTVYWEKQMQGLCAVHCLNSLLQRPYITKDTLADVSKQLGQDEMRLLAPDSLRDAFQNMVDDGNFSIQVIIRVLQAMGLDVQNALHEDNRECFLSQPELEEAYVVNANHHWFAVRKLHWFGHIVWFDLNSTAGGGPTLLETGALKTLLQHPDNSSVLIIRGEWPCPHSHDSELTLDKHQQLLDPTDLERMQKRYRDRRDRETAKKRLAHQQTSQARALDDVDYGGGAGAALLGMTLGAAVFPCFHGVCGGIMGAVMGWMYAQDEQSSATENAKDEGLSKRAPKASRKT
eukprot:TRINITY_DN94096_c0_g1_i1.p1 TRINITY_DN94096_c0_g1~~TRINITY_DN94096_c0_g1_i1.p1  ORF type:complete len:406 (-),score=62.57 TRINITY_DN94096_c0_g1_i1:195-1412(-)